MPWQFGKVKEFGKEWAFSVASIGCGGGGSCRKGGSVLIILRKSQRTRLSGKDSCSPNFYPGVSECKSMIFHKSCNNQFQWAGLCSWVWMEAQFKTHSRMKPP